MTPIYYIAHGRNLRPIVATGHILCHALMLTEGRDCAGIAHDHLKRRRSNRRVRNSSTGRDVCAGGVMADYVPFYFATRTPMLCAIHNGRVPGLEGGQRAIVYLVSSVETVAANTNLWCSTDGHGLEAVTEFYDSANGLGHVDWAAVAEPRWSTKLGAEVDLQRRKQAEFLVHQRFPWEWVERIAVMDADLVRRVQELIGGGTHQPPVEVRREWYY